jgi:anti-sigma-K factor RskA
VILKMRWMMKEEEDFKELIGRWQKQLTKVRKDRSQDQISRIKIFILESKKTRRQEEGRRKGGRKKGV